MNYNKVIKDLKERNDKLQEQYRLRDIRCIHLEYENEMLKSDFKAQHELTKKYAEETKDLRKQLEAINEQANYLRKSVERKEETIIELQDEKVPYTNEYVAKLENQQKEFVKYLEDKLCIANEVLDNPEEDEDTRGYVLARKFMLEEILSKYQEIIGVAND